mgnify:CR=1 FL=1
MVLASCSDDRFIKLYDLTRSGSKRGFRSLHDAYPVNSIAFHPSGDFLAAATQDTLLRIHDLHRGNCYVVNKNSSDQHTGALQQVNHYLVIGQRVPFSPFPPLVTDVVPGDV